MSAAATATAPSVALLRGDDEWTPVACEGCGDPLPAGIYDENGDDYPRPVHTDCETAECPGCGLEMTRAGLREHEWEHLSRSERGERW